jgi:myo-inositol 2-dehydrogenase/D-chiro-inositol 1-dehydrogenase/scyllo-inositol 2-dehydrogenase (NAD+)
MKAVKLGIIGLGYIGQIHLRNCLKLKNARVIAAADLSKKARNRAKELGVKRTFRNYEELLEDPEVDAVIIALPTHLHLQCATQAAEAKKHIFLEKPMARNVKEAKEILSTVERNSVKLMMGYPLRFEEIFKNLKKEIDDGLVGDVEIAHAAYISSGPFFHRAEGSIPRRVPEWWFNKELTGGGALIDLGSHIINLLRWYFGEITDIKSCLRYRFNLDFEDSVTCLARFESGTLAVISVGWFSQGYHLRIDLHGSVKSISAQHLPSNPILTVIQMLTTGIPKFYRAHFAELQCFVNCLLNGLSPSPSGEDGLKDLEAISQAYKNQVYLGNP